MKRDVFSFSAILLDGTPHSRSNSIRALALSLKYLLLMNFNVIDYLSYLIKRQKTCIEVEEYEKLEFRMTAPLVHFGEGAALQFSLVRDFPYTFGTHNKFHPRGAFFFSKSTPNA